MAATKKKATKGKAATRAKSASTKVSAKKATARKSAAKKAAAPKKTATRKTAARKAAPRKTTAQRGPQRSEAATRKKTPIHPVARRAAERRARPAPEQPSLDELTHLLRDRMTSRVPSDYVRGKDRLRDEVMELLSCSSARAEHIVDSMVARGYARFGRHPRFTTDPRFGIWHLDDSP